MKNTPLALKILLPVLLLALGIGTAVFFKKSAPQVGKRPSQTQAPIARVVEVSSRTAHVTIRAQGLVVPSREVAVKSLVSGIVEDMSPDFSPGGLFSEGQELIALKQDEYLIEVRRLKGLVAQAMADVDLEQGQQIVAGEAYDVLSQTMELPDLKSDLLLRKPNLRKVLAALETARAQLEKAELDLERTVIHAPFDCLVTERTVSQGSYVNTNETLGTVVATDAYWIELSLPLDRLAFIDAASQPRAKVRAQYGDGQWSGTVLRPTGSVRESSRMAGILVSVTDPLGIAADGQATPLMLGDWVDVAIEGTSFDNVIALPREVLRDENTVWVAMDNALDIRTVDIVWKDTQEVLIRQGLEDGDQVIVSDLAAPVQGMALSPEPVSTTGTDSGADLAGTEEAVQ